MSKFLYITDQDEHTDHSFIGPLFQKYLTKHFDINTIFFSNTKEFIEIKDDGRIIVPELFKTNLLENLEEYDLKLSEFDFVVVRNSIGLLKEVLKQKNRYDFKVGFRLSFQKELQNYKQMKQITKNLYLM